MVARAGQWVGDTVPMNALLCFRWVQLLRGVADQVVHPAPHVVGEEEEAQLEPRVVQLKDKLGLAQLDVGQVRRRRVIDDLAHAHAHVGNRRDNKHTQNVECISLDAHSVFSFVRVAQWGALLAQPNQPVHTAAHLHPRRPGCES